MERSNMENHTWAHGQVKFRGVFQEARRRKPPKRMYSLEMSDEFIIWRNSLSRSDWAKIRWAIRKFETNGSGDKKQIDPYMYLTDEEKAEIKHPKEVWELRLHFSPQYRLYYLYRDAKSIYFIYGGLKSTQRNDIQYLGGLL